MSDALDLPAEIMDWIGTATGGSVVSAVRVPGGATREAWFVDVDPGDGSVEPLFLRYSRGAHPPTSASHSLRVEGEIFKALHGAGLQVPAIRAIHPTAEAMLEERLSGSTWFYRIADPDEQVRTAQAFIRHLAAQHRLRPATLELPSLGLVRSVPEHVREGLAAMRARSTDDEGGIDPFLDLCIGWLEDNIPAYEGPAVLVQGDTGPGNFLYENGAVTAVVDWELAHLGDPMEDIAWLSLRAVQDTFTHFPDRLREYEELSGIQVDEARVWYYRLHAETLLASVRSAAAARRGAPGDEDAPRQARDIGNGLIYGILHRRLTIESLGHLLGIDLDRGELPPTPEPLPWHGLYDDVAENIRLIAPRVSDPLAADWLKGVARVLRYLKELDRSGRAYLDAERAELTDVLGADPGSSDAAAAALNELVRAGALSAEDHVHLLWRQVMRDDELLRTASGSLRRRSWPLLFDAAAPAPGGGGAPAAG